MTNPYYTKTFNAIPLTVIPSSAHNAQYALVEDGFDAVDVDIQALDTEVSDARQGDASLLIRLQRYIVATAGLTVNLPANGFRITGLVTPVAGDEPATKTYADGLAFATTLPAQVGNARKFIKTDGTTAAWSYAEPEVQEVVGTTQTAVPGVHYVLANVAATTVTLPAVLTAGDVIWVSVGNGRTDNVIARNGHLIMGLAEDVTIDNPAATVGLRYISAGIGLRII